MAKHYETYLDCCRSMAMSYVRQRWAVSVQTASVSMLLTAARKARACPSDSVRSLPSPLYDSDSLSVADSETEQLIEDLDCLRDGLSL